MIGRWFKRKNAAVAWPELPESGFIAGRAAGVDDVECGHAVFSQQVNDQMLARPMPIEIPQYGLWTDDQGNDLPVLVVQAEHHITDTEIGGVFGLRTLAGEEVVATQNEVRLLGVGKPTG